MTGQPDQKDRQRCRIPREEEFNCPSKSQLPRRRSLTKDAAQLEPANASYKHQARNEGVTEIIEMPSPGHAPAIDGDWREVAGTALTFVQRCTQPAQPPHDERHGP